MVHRLPGLTRGGSLPTVEERGASRSSDACGSARGAQGQHRALAHGPPHGARRASPRSDLTQSGFEVILQKSIFPQIRQLIHYSH